MRTDRTRACAHCALRFSSPDCPRCHGGEVYSIADKFFAAALERAGARDSPRATRAERLSWWLEWLARWNATVIAILSGAIAFTLIIRLPRLFHTGRMLLFFIAATAGALTLLSAVLRTIFEVKRDAMIDESHRKLRPLALAADPAPDPTLKRSTVRGKVRAPQPVTAPLSRVSCAAFRLLGSAPSGPLDDGGGTRFEVIVEGGGAPVLVELGAATLRLERFGKRVRLRPQGKLADFLRPRALVGDGEVELEEALLRNGDEVVVEGTCDEMARGGGYRDTATVRVFKEFPGSPLVIRG